MTGIVGDGAWEDSKDIGSVGSEGASWPLAEKGFPGLGGHAMRSVVVSVVAASVSELGWYNRDSASHGVGGAGKTEALLLGWRAPDGLLPEGF